MIVPLLALRLSESSNNLLDNSVRSSFNFLSGLVLDWMRYVHRVEIRTVESRGLGTCGRLELASGDGYGGHSQILQIYGVVQTARCTRPSIGKRLNNRIDGSKLFDDRGRGRLRERRLHCAHHIGYVKALAEQPFESIEEEAATCLADVQQTDGLAAQTW